MRTVVFIAALLFSSTAFSEQDEEREGICNAFTDMAIVARALAIEGIEPERSVRIMHVIYSGPAMTEQIVRVMDKLTSAAYESRLTTIEFASQIMAMCITPRGIPL